MIKRSLLLCVCLIWAHLLPAQTIDLEENVPIALPSGISVSYSITNSVQKEIRKKGTYNRCEVTLVVANNGGCDWIRVFTGNERSTNAREFPILRVDCNNATGINLTNKGDDIEPEQFNAMVSQQTTVNGQSQTVKNAMHIGYALLRGRTIQKNYIFIVPQNEKPKIQIRPY